MTVGIYDQAVVALDGETLRQTVAVSVRFAGSESVLVLLGAGGGQRVVVDPGTKYMIVDCELAVPTKNSTDLLLINRYVKAERVALKVLFLGSGRKITTKEKGTLTAPSLAARVGANLVYSFGWIGPAGEV